MPEHIASWAYRVSGLSPADDALPEDVPGVNIILNRRRLARWLSTFESDRDIKDFLLLDAFCTSLNVPVSSTGLPGTAASLALRPFRLWEYCWIYKCLGLAAGGGRILDIGGPASHLSLLTALAGNRIHSIDVNPNFVDDANRAARILSLPDYTAAAGDGRDLSVFESQSFDAVICCSVLEHLTGEDQRILLGQVERILRPGGLVGLTFDYGPSAAGMNEHLPPPHEPPGSALEVFARYEIGGLQIVGNRNLEEPVPGSLFSSSVVRYTMASLFLSTQPVREPGLPAPEKGRSTIFENVRIPDLIPRSFDASVARYQAENETRSRGTDSAAIARIEEILGKQAQANGVGQEHLEASEQRAAAAASLVAQREREIQDLNVATQVRDAEIDRWRHESEYYAAELSRHLGRIRELELESVAAIALSNAQADHWREKATMYSAEADRIADELARQTEETNARTEQARIRLESAHQLIVTQQTEFFAARMQMESEVSKLRERLDASEAGVTALNAAVTKYRESLNAISAEALSKLLFRRFLDRIPNPRNQYALHPVPGYISRDGVLATIHRLVNLGINAYIQKHRKKEIVYPKITVITPVLNGEEYISRAIESVLGQNYPNLEYLIEDGGSTDRTLEIVERYRSRLSGVHSERDHGMYDAIGRGFERATGEILCYLNSDDVFLFDALLRIGKYFSEHPLTDVIHHTDVVDINGWRYANVAQKDVVFNDILHGHILFQAGVFFRRRAYDAAGGINRSMKLAGDWDLWLRMARHSRFRLLPGHVSCFYVRSGQLSSRMDLYKAEMSERRVVIRAELRLPERTRHAISELALRWRNFFRSSEDRLLFPIDFSQMPPPPVHMPQCRVALRCPFTGEMPDRHLFSSRDIRSGFPSVSDFQYVTESHLVVCGRHPVDGAPPCIDEAYDPPKRLEFIPPDARFGSPYRLFRRKGFVLRLVRNILAPRLLSRLVGLSWEDPTASILIASLKAAGVKVHQTLSFLDAGCFDGDLLDALKQRTGWNLHEAEADPLTVREVLARGHRVFSANAIDAVFSIPARERFDVVFLGSVIEYAPDPVQIMRRVSTLLAPGGRIVIATPNLDSRQVDLFGPAHSHWHLPYQRQILSLKAMESLAKKTNLRVDFAKTYSHPRRTAVSLWLNNTGLGAIVPHGIDLPHDIRNHARSIATWSRLFWDHRGKGDYLCVVFSKE